MKKAVFRIWRGDAKGGAFVDYPTEISEGMVVLDAVPALFTADSSGGGQGAILNHDMAPNSKDNPEASCLPMGNTQFWTQGFPRKFVHTPKLLVVLYEASAGLRQIYIDGRPLPNEETMGALRPDLEEAVDDT